MTDPYINITKEDARSILLMPDEELPKLLEAAYTLRKKHKGNMVSIHLLPMPAAVTVPRTALTVPSQDKQKQTLIPMN